MNAIEKRIAAKIIKTGRVADLRDERRVGDDSENGGGDGIWAYLSPGLKCVCSDTHAVHEWTMPAVERAVMNAVPCDCGCRHSPAR
jgi:hypothetical protein